jgi:hypothetical protein
MKLELEPTRGGFFTPQGTYTPGRLWRGTLDGQQVVAMIVFVASDEVLAQQPPPMRECLAVMPEFDDRQKMTLADLLKAGGSE